MAPMFKFKPLDHVHIKPLEGLIGRITRCIYDAGPLNIYTVHYLANCEGKSLEFYEDELELVERQEEIFYGG